MDYFPKKVLIRNPLIEFIGWENYDESIPSIDLLTEDKSYKYNLITNKLSNGIIGKLYVCINVEKIIFFLSND